MVAQPVQRMTPEEYLAFERASAERHEFVGGEVFAMAGASLNHITITSNGNASLHAQLRRTPCRVLTNDLKVRFRVRDYVYPDLTIVCGEPEFHDTERDVVINPTVIIEVLSDSTETYDRNKKFSLYKAIPTVQEVLLIAQDRPRIEQYRRQDGEVWLYRDVIGLDGVIALPAVGATLALADVYERVTFEPDPDDDPLP
jgi:Uma2 family endonuclease